MKQFKVEGDLVKQSLQGLAWSNPLLLLLDSNVVVSRHSISDPDKVTLVSGGGSGHEPTHSGFVGDGMLDAVAVGQIFASPSSVQVERAISAVKSKKGTLVIVKNYTGDVLHFGLAAEKARAAGIDTRVLIVGDDVAVGRAQGKLVGRRALAGTVLVHKVAGAAAAAGLSLDEVEKYAKAVADNIATAAGSLDHCNVPGREFSTELKSNEFEVGLGIHNEPGVERHSPIPTIYELINSHLLPLILNKDKDRSFVDFGWQDEVLLLVNNLGGLSQFELTYATNAAIEVLKKNYSIHPTRVITATYTTAFNGPGFSITLLNLTKAGPKILDFLHSPTRAPAWQALASPKEWSQAKIEVQQKHSTNDKHTRPQRSNTHVPAEFEASLRAGLQRVIAAEPEITRYDTVAGDGDAGETLKAGADAVTAALDRKRIDLTDASLMLSSLSEIVDEAMGGTSGGLYSIFLTAFGQQVIELKAKTLDLPTTAKAAKGALDTLLRYTKARVGDRTLVDALQPFVDSLSRGNSPSDAVAAAQKGADSTAKLRARAGRAAYVQQDDLESEEVPDPGAYGLVELLKGLCNVK